MRVATLNLWGTYGDWPARRAVLVDGLRALAPDVITFQEAVKTDDVDTARDLLGPEYEVVHQTQGLLGDGNVGVIASRWPLRGVEEIVQQVTPRTADFPAMTMVAEIDGPAPIGELLVVHHMPSWEPPLEHERELQAVAAVKRVDDIAGSRHVVLAGDLNAAPDSASVRFLRGLQSLGGTSAWYLDAWDWVHPAEPGHTFTTANPLVMEESPSRLEVDRRIDYVLVRCDERGPTLGVSACWRLFDDPVDGVWASDHFGVVADLEPL